MTRRFILQTPTTSGANDSVGFAEGFLTVTGTGMSKLTADGNPEAWFDPAQPVTIFFTHLGGEWTDVTGILPLHHSVVVNQTIQRFTIIASERSFVNVTALVCAYP